MTIRVDATTSWMVVCPNFGQGGHAYHAASMDTLEEAEAKAGMNDRLYARLAKRTNDSDLDVFYRSEVGWRVQKQTVTEWEMVA